MIEVMKIFQKKLQFFNLIAIVVYLVLFVLAYIGVGTADGYNPLSTVFLVFSILSLTYFGLALFFLLKRREENKLIRVAAWLNIILLLWFAVVMISGIYLPRVIAQLIGDYMFVVFYGSAFISIIGSTVGSLVVFAIGFIKSKKSIFA